MAQWHKYIYIYLRHCAIVYIYIYIVPSSPGEGNGLPTPVFHGQRKTSWLLLYLLGAIPQNYLKGFLLGYSSQ